MSVHEPEFAFATPQGLVVIYRSEDPTSGHVDVVLNPSEGCVVTSVVDANGALRLRMQHASRTGNVEATR